MHWFALPTYAKASHQNNDLLCARRYYWITASTTFTYGRTGHFLAQLAAQCYHVQYHEKHEDAFDFTAACYQLLPWRPTGVDIRADLRWLKRLICFIENLHRIYASTSDDNDKTEVELN
jgi:hypothetical protein